MSNISSEISNIQEKFKTEPKEVIKKYALLANYSNIGDVVKEISPLAHQDILLASTIYVYKRAYSYITNISTGYGESTAKQCYNNVMQSKLRATFEYGMRAICTQPNMHKLTVAKLFRGLDLMNESENYVEKYIKTSNKVELGLLSDMYKNIKDVVIYLSEYDIIPRIQVEKPEKFGKDVVVIGTYADERQMFGCRIKDRVGNKYDILISPDDTTSQISNIVRQMYNVVGQGRDEEYTPIKRVYEGDKLWGYIMRHTVENNSREEIIPRQVALGICNRKLIPTCSIDKDSMILRGRKIKLGDLPKIQKSELQK